MERWSGKIAIVTGASSGIGASIVQKLINSRMQVIGLARRIELMEELKLEIVDDYRENFHPMKCDISNLDSIKATFSIIRDKFESVHVLINNAGILKAEKILDSDENDLKEIVDINFMGCIYCIKEAYKLMKASGEECHIININSILGHAIPVLPNLPMNYNLYPCTKFALRAANEVLKQELLGDTNFRVSNVSPGLVKTQIGHTAKNALADRIMNSKEILYPEDVAETVIFILGVPKHVQISEIFVTPTGQKY